MTDQDTRQLAEVRVLLAEVRDTLEALPDAFESKWDTTADWLARELVTGGASSLRSVEEAVDDVRSVLVAGLDPRDWTSVLVTLLRTAIVAGGACVVLWFVWWLVGAPVAQG